MTNNQTNQFCAFIAIIGAPNAGKSTLMNKIVGQKISIVSPRVQTTRTRILGVLIHNQAQLVFIDTPGIFEASKSFEKALVKNAWQAQHDADCVMVVIDVSKKPFFAQIRTMITKITKLSNQKKVVCVLNKVDLVDKQALLELAKQLWDQQIFQEIFMVSAITGEGIDRLIAYLVKNSPQQPWHFPSDQVSDLPLRLLAAEITREQLFYHVHDEVPHDSIVIPESWNVKDNNELVIHQIIYVTRVGQKAILIGDRGQKIKAIRLASQRQLTEIMQTKVHLYLKVGVNPKWQEDQKLLKLVGFTS